MQTRRDHMQAYQFAMGRLATALVTGDPGRGDSPTRRAALGTFFGAGIVVLLSVGFLIYGKLSPVTTAAWRQPGSIIVEKETGNRYLYLGGELRPVRNYASALLLTGKGAAVRTVASKALADVPHGAPVGIDGAPDSVPTAANLLSPSWTDCLRPDLAAGQVFDFAPGARAAAFPSGKQALLAAPDGTRYVLWQGTKYPVPSDSTLIALGLDADRSIAAPAAWLAGVPTGVALAPARIEGVGKSAGQVGGQPSTVGQLFSTSAAGAKRFYVMTSAGVAPVSATEAALLAAQHGAPAPRQVSVSDIAAARVSDDQSMTSALPDVLNAPSVDTTTRAVCLRESSQGTRLTAQAAVESGAAATGADPVLVPPSHGVYAVDQGQLAAQASNPQTWLITDQGVAYPLGDSSAAQDLGIGGGTETALPGSVLAALPHGPALDRTAAAATVQGQQPAASPSAPASASASAPAPASAPVGGGSGAARGSRAASGRRAAVSAPAPSVSRRPAPTGSAKAG
ncbi:type VII secretion protein EccB [Streptomyces sp. ICBB 8177]|uniref:type VII secretion protein EccB n=1 Tax=Streptomyces sp. ICBB 8177 TaxID=563922 RepID=UPI000D678800|nr:type VII secretion protein EccB [Streptomyces sp. ICBB 8177]PWI42174.1 type VII secretion protein EccB [Streptomyces sp. ICBB 8177]